jgi:hypothetical protein
MLLKSCMFSLNLLQSTYKPQYPSQLHHPHNNLVHTSSDYTGFAPLGNVTLNTNTWLSKSKPDASLYGCFPKLMKPVRVSYQFLNLLLKKKQAIVFDGLGELTVLRDEIVIGETDEVEIFTGILVVFLVSLGLVVVDF